MLGIIFPALSLALFAGLLIVTFTVKREEKYDLRRYFPFEAVSTLKPPVRMWFILLVGLTAGLMAESYLLAFWDLSFMLGKVVLVFYVVSVILMFALFTVSLYSYRVHLILSTVFFVTTVIGSFLTLTTALIGYDSLIRFNLPLAAVMALVGLVLLIILFVPKLKYWMYLEKSEENGKTVYVRPKVSILSLYEWIFVLAHALNMLLLLIQGIIRLI